jgi:hypothetical protein
MKKENVIFMNEETQEGVQGATMSQEEIASRLGVPEGAVIEQTDVAVEGTETPETEEGQQSDFKPSSYWDIVKDVEGFEMPADVTAENEEELLRPYIAKKFGIEIPEPVKIEDILHPVAKKVQDMIESNPQLSVLDIAKELSNDMLDVSHMTEDQLIRMDILDRFGLYDEEKNPDGVTEEEIEDSIEKMSRLDKKQRAALIKDNINAKNESKKLEYAKVAEQQREKAYNEYLQTVEKTCTKLLADLKDTTDIYGVKISQSDLNDYITEFKEFLKPDKATGERKLDQWLSNDQKLFKLFVLDVMQGEDSMKELITQGRESAKEEILNRLKLTPPKKGTQGTRLNMQDPETLRLKLGSPEGAIL